MHHAHTAITLFLISPTPMHTRPHHLTHTSHTTHIPYRCTHGHTISHAPLLHTQPDFHHLHHLTHTHMHHRHTTHAPPPKPPQSARLSNVGGDQMRQQQRLGFETDWFKTGTLACGEHHLRPCKGVVTRSLTARHSMKCIFERKSPKGNLSVAGI